MKSSGFRIGLLTFFSFGRKMKHSSLQDCLDEDFMAMNLVNHLHLWASTPHEDSWRCLSWKVRTGFFLQLLGLQRCSKFLSWVIESLSHWKNGFRFLGSALWFQHGLWTANPATPGTIGDRWADRNRCPGLLPSVWPLLCSTRLQDGFHLQIFQEHGMEVNLNGQKLVTILVQFYCSIFFEGCYIQIKIRDVNYKHWDPTDPGIRLWFAAVTFVPPNSLQDDEVKHKIGLRRLL